MLKSNYYNYNHFSALWTLSGTTWVSRYQKKHSPTHTHHGHQSSQTASSINYDPWHPPTQSMLLQSFPTISLQVFFGLPLGLAPSTSYSIHFFTQSLSSFRIPYHRDLFCCSTEIMSSNPSLSLNPYFAHPSNHSHLCLLTCHPIFLSYRPGLTSVQHTTSHTTAVQSPSHYQ